MSLPTFIAVEAAHQDEQSFPVSLAWSLADGRIKQAWVQPENDWLEAASEAQLAVSDSDFSLEAYPVDEVVRELLYDQTDDVYQVAQLHPQEAWLLKLFAAAEKEVTFELVEAAPLGNREAWQETYQQTLDFLGLDARRAEDQVRALLETHVILTGEQPEIDSLEEKNDD